MLTSAAVRPASLALLVIACVAACPSAAGAQGMVAGVAAPGCVPPGAVTATSVASAKRSDGTTELTEFRAGGEYRVTRCAKGGGLLVSETVSPVLAPGGATVLVPTEVQRPGVAVAMLYGDPADPAWAAGFDAARADLQAAVIAPTVAPPAGPPVALPLAAPAPAPAGPRLAARAAAVAGDACTNGQYNFWQTSWGDPRLQLLRQPQPLQLQRHIGRVDRQRSPQLGHDVQQLRLRRHHQSHVASPRLDERDGPHRPRRPVRHRQGQPREHLPRGARVHLAVHRRRRRAPARPTSASTRTTRSRTSARPVRMTTSRSRRTRPATASASTTQTRATR